MNYDDIGSFIMKKRKEKNMTQKELALKIGVTDKAVSKWERGLGCPDVSILENLSSELDVSILEILKGRNIKKEELLHDNINDYVLETLDYSKKEIKRKYKSIILNIFTILIIGISSFLFFININHIMYLSEKDTYNFDNELIKEMKAELNLVKQNISIIKNNKGKFTEEEHEKIVKYFEDEYQKYEKIEMLNYTGEKSLNMNDLYIWDLYNIGGFNFNSIYRIISKYDSSLETYYSLQSTNLVLKTYLLTETFENPTLSYQYEMVSMIKTDMELVINKVYTKVLYVSSLIKEFLYVTENVIEVGDIYE